MISHSSILAWKTPWTEEPGKLQSIRFAKVLDNVEQLNSKWQQKNFLEEIRFYDRKIQPVLAGQVRGALPKVAIKIKALRLERSWCCGDYWESVTWGGMMGGCRQWGGGRQWIWTPPWDNKSKECVKTGEVHSVWNWLLFILLSTCSYQLATMQPSSKGLLKSEDISV